MSTSLKLILLFPLAMAAGIWAAVESGAGVDQDHSEDIRAADIALATEIVFPVRVAVVRRSSLLREVRVAGTLRPSRSLPVAFRVAGVLVRHVLWNGRRVQKGEELGALDDHGFRREYDLAAAQLLAANIEYRSLAGTAASTPQDTCQSAREVRTVTERIQALEDAYRAGAIPAPAFRREQREAASQIAYLTADRGDVIALKCGLVAAVEQEDRARSNLAASIISAPFAGVLANCRAESGAWVEAGKELGVLIEVSHLLLDADVLESEVRFVRQGDSAVVKVPAIGDVEFAGVVRHVNPIHEDATRSALVTIAMSPRAPCGTGEEDSPRPGMYASARIVVDRLPGRTLVPRDAVLLRANRSMVFLVRGGRSHWAYVEVGETTESAVAITRGVAPGDTVVVDGHFALAHNTRVRVDSVEGML